MYGWGQRCGQRHRERERQAEDFAVDPVRHHPVIVLLVPSQKVSATESQQVSAKE
jgi:hypothetical protein